MSPCICFSSSMFVGVKVSCWPSFTDSGTVTDGLIDWSSEQSVWSTAAGTCREQPLSASGLWVCSVSVLLPCWYLENKKKKRVESQNVWVKYLYERDEIQRETQGSDVQEVCFFVSSTRASCWTIFRLPTAPLSAQSAVIQSVGSQSAHTGLSTRHV